MEKFDSPDYFLDGTGSSFVFFLEDGGIRSSSVFFLLGTDISLALFLVATTVISAVYLRVGTIDISVIDVLPELSEMHKSELSESSSSSFIY